MASPLEEETESLKPDSLVHLQIEFRLRDMDADLSTLKEQS